MSRDLNNHRGRFSRGQFWLILFLSGLLLFTGISRVGRASTQPFSTQSLVEQGLEHYHRDDYANAIRIWNQALRDELRHELRHDLAPDLAPERPVTLPRYLARAYQASGQLEAATAQFDALIQHYRHQPDPKEWGRMLTEQAQNYGRLGRYPESVSLLCRQVEALELEASLDSDIPLARQSLGCNSESAAAIALDAEDAVGLAAALGSLGQVQLQYGEYDQAIAALQKGLQQLAQINTQSPEFPAYRKGMLNSLGNLYAARAARSLRFAEFAQTKQETEAMQRFFQQVKEDNQLAQATFEQATFEPASFEPASLEKSLQEPASTSANQATPDAILQTAQGRMQAMDVARRSWAEGSRPSQQQASAWEQARRELRSLPASRAHIYALIKLSALSQPLASLQIPLPPNITLKTQTMAAAGLNFSAFRASAPTYCAPLGPQTLTVLQEARYMAQRLQDQPAESSVLGQIGHLYECQGRLTEALNVTRNARVLAPDKNSRYRWDWQEARILQAQGDQKRSLEAYEELLLTLKGIRGELAVAAQDFQSDFWETIDPIYRELLPLRLAAIAASTEQTRDRQTSDRQTSDILERVLQDLDELHLFELQNYLGRGCELPTPEPLAAIDRSTAFLSTLVLQDRLAVMLTLPTDELIDIPASITTLAKTRFKLRSQLYWVDLNRAQVATAVNEFRRSLSKRSDRANGYKAGAEQFYDALIRPGREALAASGVTTLMFMHDGLLRSLPMAPLSDGKQFLIEQYALAYTPSISLIEPRAMKPKVSPNAIVKPSATTSEKAREKTREKTREKAIAEPSPKTSPKTNDKSATPPTPPPASLQVTAFGLTQPAEVTFQGQSLYFPGLEHVAEELAGMEQALPSVQALLNPDFTLERIRQEISRVEPTTQILHLATHARFGFDARQTFLVTGRPGGLTPLAEVPFEPSKAQPSAPAQITFRRADALLVARAIHAPSSAPPGGLNPSAQHLLQQHLSRQHLSQQHLSRQRLNPKLTNDKLTLARMQSLGRLSAQPLELLTLSACQTATGSERDILGIAGITIQSGIGSTVASLWRVDDEATAVMMGQFYHALQAGKGRAIALQSMQKDWLERSHDSAYRHPGYWSPFILVGNWF